MRKILNGAAHKEQHCNGWDVPGMPRYGNFISLHGLELSVAMTLQKKLCWSGCMT